MLGFLTPSPGVAFFFFPGKGSDNQVGERAVQKSLRLYLELSPVLTGRIQLKLS